MKKIMSCLQGTCSESMCVKMRPYRLLILAAMAAALIFFGAWYKGILSFSKHSHDDEIDALVEQRLSSSTDKIARRLARQITQSIDMNEREARHQAKNDLDRQIREEVSRQLRGND